MPSNQVYTMVMKLFYVQLLKMVDKEQAQKVADEYSQRAQEFDKRTEQYYRDHPQARQASDDWQVELELEQNVRHIAEMQAQLQIGMKYVTFCSNTPFHTVLCSILHVPIHTHTHTHIQHTHTHTCTIHTYTKILTSYPGLPRLLSLAV